MKKTKWLLLIPASVWLAGAAVAGQGFDRYSQHKGMCGGGGMHMMHGGMRGKMMMGGMGRGDGGGFFMRRMADELELSEEQRKTIRQKVSASRDKAAGIKDEMYEGHKVLHELMWSDNQDEAELRKLADKQGNYASELIVLRAQTKQAIVSVLTDQQREKMKQLADKRGMFRGSQ